MERIFRFAALSISLFVAYALVSCSSKEQRVGLHDFVVSQGGSIATIYVADSEPYSVKRAVGDLQNDLEMVVGIRPEVTSDINALSGRAIIVGTLNNPTIKELALSQSEGESLEGMVESFLIKPLTKPFAAVESALLVAGSDPLGAIFGAYEISERAGVSPIYWWVDSTPKRVENLTLSDVCILPKEPSVRYRAIFINDEEAMIKWSGNTTEGGENQGVTPETYKRVFELMLRLKANTLWPSMMEAGRYFFEAKDERGVAINPKNATDYGVYVGSSHCENMARNNYDEWYDWAEKNAQKYNIEKNHYFDYTLNPKAIVAYWRERLEESKEFNMIYTLGIRGVHDSAMQLMGMKNPTLENRVKLLQGVITLQRQMIKEVFGSEDAVPQIFVPYEETGEIYNGESRDGKEKCKGLDIPEDVILVSTEDNYGYVRQSPAERDLKRAGGNGIYYHLCYQGFPSPYDWLSLIPLTTVREQLRKVYDEGSTKFWIVNVGDVKPTEIGLKYFMESAWDLDATYSQPTKEYMSDVAQQIYGVDRELARECAELLTDLQQTACSQKPEFMSSFWSINFYDHWLFDYYSHFDFGDEAMGMIERYKRLEKRAKGIAKRLSKSAQDPFYHTLLYPIRAARTMAEKSYYYQRNYYYANQGRFRSAAAYKALSLKAAKEIDDDLRYYNEELSGGKWRGIMDPYGDYNLTERVYDIAGIPKKFIYSEVFEEEAVEALGAVAEGQVTGAEQVELHFSSLEDNRRFIDIFTRGLSRQSWSAKCSEEWVKLSKESGTIEAEERILVSVDYSKLKSGESLAEVTIEGENCSKTFPIRAYNFTEEIEPKSYVEGGGFVAIEAEHYTDNVAGAAGAEWIEYGDYGYVGSSMFVKGGEKVESATAQSGARLEYKVLFTTAGEFRGELYRIPTLNEGKGKSCEVAIGIDGSEPQVLHGVRHKGQQLTTTLPNGKSERRQWQSNVFCQMERIPFVIKVDKAGYHTIKLYQVDTHIGVDRVVIATDKQAEEAMARAIIAAPMSYNNITNFKRSRVAKLPTLSSEDCTVQPYPNPKAEIYAKHLFSQYGAPAVWGFTPVTTMDVYDPRINTFGWRKEDTKHIKATHNESTRKWPHWQRDMIVSNRPARFSMKLLEGRYDLTLYSGTVRYTYAFAPAKDLRFSVEANGVKVLDNELFKENAPSSRTFEVRVGKNNTLDLDLSGQWGVSAIEVYRK